MAPLLVQARTEGQPGNELLKHLCPIVLVYVFSMDYYVSGLTQGAIK